MEPTRGIETVAISSTGLLSSFRVETSLRNEPVSPGNLSGIFADFTAFSWSDMPTCSRNFLAASTLFKEGGGGGPVGDFIFDVDDRSSTLRGFLDAEVCGKQQRK